MTNRDPGEFTTLRMSIETAENELVRDRSRYEDYCEQFNDINAGRVKATEDYVEDLAEKLANAEHDMEAAEDYLDELNDEYGQFLQDIVINKEYALELADFIYMHFNIPVRT